jgi:integrase
LTLPTELEQCSTAAKLLTTLVDRKPLRREESRTRNCADNAYCLNSDLPRDQKSMAKSHLRIVTPPTENRTVTPRRRKNADLRAREHLTADEVERLIVATKHNRYGHRDALMVLLTFRHGLRAAEICDLRWEQVDFKRANTPRAPRQKRNAGHASVDGSGDAGAPASST